MSRKTDIFEAVLTSPYNHSSFVDFVREFLNDMEMVAPAQYKKIYNNFSYYVDGYYHIGNYQGDNGEKIAIFSVALKKGDSVERSRTMQRNFIKPLIEAGNCAGALVAFYTPEEPDKWRLSFIRLDYEFSKGKVTEKLTPAKRYSYLVGKGEPCNTAKQRLFPIFQDDSNNPGIDDLEEAFSVEKVTNEFFQLYCEKYHELREYLESNEEFMQEAQIRNFTSEQFAKKLLGQIVFLYFIQKKGWLGVDAIPVIMTEKEYKDAFFARGQKSRDIVGSVYTQQADGTYRVVFDKLRALSEEDEDFLAGIVKGKPWGTGPRDFMRRMFDGCVDAGKNYFDDYLEPLFYTGLNMNRGENGYYPPLHRRIPFLNGGLFEQLDNYEWENNNFNIPNSLFSNADVKGKRDADGILDIFDRYNFTMNEDEPMEREVAIDPEMLGKVFENLLDVKDRKSKGAFYTPREIVHYMCQETLINHLVTKTGISEKAIRDFILYGEYLRDEDTVKTLKVTDASGKIHFEFDKNKDLLISEEILSYKKGVNRLKEIDDLLANVKVADLAVGSGAFPLGMLNEIVRSRQVLTEYLALEMNGFQKKTFYAYERKPYDLKLNTIKNCIFACDIEPSAVDIAKLRLWLSIVIDDEIAEDAGNGEFDAHTKPRQLPNLDCNIICGNSLVDEFMGYKLITESVLLNNVSTNSQGSVFQQSVDVLISKLIELQDKLFFTKEHTDKEEIKQEIQKIYDDIILEQIGGDHELRDAYFESIVESSKPFILWQLYFPRVFKENGGFDIIIGNPPYIEFKKLDSESKDIFKKRFQSANGKYDIYVVFMEYACELLNKEGTLAFINPTMFMKRDYGKAIRKFVYENFRIKSIVDFSDKQMFESATTYTGIFIYDKNGNEEKTIKYYKLNKDLNISNASSLYGLLKGEMFSYIEKNQNDLGESWSFEDEEDAELLNIISNKTCTLKSITTAIFQGIASGKDEVFYVDESTICEYGLEKKLLKKLYKGKDIKKYNASWSGYYVLYPYIKNQLVPENELIEKYPNTYSYLCKMRELLKGRGYFDKSSKKWYELWNQRDSNNFDEPFKIITAEINRDNNFYLDTEGAYGNTKIYTIILKNRDESFYYYLLGLLNSDVLDYVYKKLSVPKAGGFYAYKTQFLELLPIKLLDNRDVRYLEIVELTQKLCEEYSEEIENRLNCLIYELYGLSDKHVELMKGEKNYGRY